MIGSGILSLCVVAPEEIFRRAECTKASIKRATKKTRFINHIKHEPVLQHRFDVVGQTRNLAICLTRFAAMPQDNFHVLC